jgi:hypothetical protein
MLHVTLGRGQLPVTLVAKPPGKQPLPEVNEDLQGEQNSYREVKKGTRSGVSCVMVHKEARVPASPED